MARFAQPLAIVGTIRMANLWPVEKCDYPEDAAENDSKDQAFIDQDFRFSNLHPPFLSHVVNVSRGRPECQLQLAAWFTLPRVTISS